MEDLEKKFFFLLEKFQWEVTIDGALKTQEDYEKNVHFINSRHKPVWNSLIELIDKYYNDYLVEEVNKKRLNEYPPDPLLARALFLKKALNQNSLYRDCKNKIIEVNEKYPMPKNKEIKKDDNINE